MTQPPAARLLDISRLVSRAGRVLTGIDRVEHAYLTRLSHDPDMPAFAIARTALGYVMLDRAGMARFADMVAAGSWPAPDLVSRLNRRLTPAARIGQSAVRRLAVGRVRGRRLSQFLAERLPVSFAYLNVGHSNLTEAMLTAVRQQPEARITVMIHDTIPLDLPQMQRPGTAEAFEARLRRVAVYADQVICVSVAGLRDVTRHMEGMGRTPPMIPAQLGVTVSPPGQLPPGVMPDGPFFVAVGTIEPRKNHALLLDIWKGFAGRGPALVICGDRGWSNAAVFALLDQGIPGVTEQRDLDDAQLSALVGASRGLLFPSLAEGFGLPPAEAAAQGVAVVCADVPVCREVLGNNATFLDPTRKDLWEREVLRLSGTKQPLIASQYRPPDWHSHFKIVFTVT